MTAKAHRTRPGHPLVHGAQDAQCSRTAISVAVDPCPGHDASAHPPASRIQPSDSEPHLHGIRDHSRQSPHRPAHHALSDRPSPTIPALIALALSRFELPRSSIHGPAHWARVMANGLRLAPITGADPMVVACFAIFHDSCRRNDGLDHQHGPRAAKWVKTLDLGMTPAQRELLIEACAGHTNSFQSNDPTVATCWDADRLDIGRVGVLADPFYMSTAAARDPAILAWAQERAAKQA